MLHEAIGASWGGEDDVDVLDGFNASTAWLRVLGVTKRPLEQAKMANARGPDFCHTYLSFTGLTVLKVPSIMFAPWLTLKACEL